MLLALRTWDPQKGACFEAFSGSVSLIRSSLRVLRKSREFIYYLRFCIPFLLFNYFLWALDHLIAFREKLSPCRFCLQHPNFWTTLSLPVGKSKKSAASLCLLILSHAASCGPAACTSTIPTTVQLAGVGLAQAQVFPTS